MRSAMIAGVLAVAVATGARAALPQPAASAHAGPSIAAITVCDEGAGDQGPSWPPGTFDTHQLVAYLWGCLVGSMANPPQRQYSSRRFTIQLARP